MPEDAQKLLDALAREFNSLPCAKDIKGIVVEHDNVSYHFNTAQDLMGRLFAVLVK